MSTLQPSHYTEKITSAHATYCNMAIRWNRVQLLVTYFNTDNEFLHKDLKYPDTKLSHDNLTTYNPKNNVQLEIFPKFIFYSLH